MHDNNKIFGHKRASLSLLLGGTSFSTRAFVEKGNAKVGSRDGKHNRERKDDNGLVDGAAGNDGSRHLQPQRAALDRSVAAVVLGEGDGGPGQRKLGRAVGQRELPVHNAHLIVVVEAVLGRLGR